MTMREFIDYLEGFRVDDDAEVLFCIPDEEEIDVRACLEPYSVRAEEDHGNGEEFIRVYLHCPAFEAAMQKSTEQYVKGLPDAG